MLSICIDIPYEKNIDMIIKMYIREIEIGEAYNDLDLYKIKYGLDDEDNILWATISKYENLSENFMEIFKNRLNWEYIIHYQNLSKQKLKKYIYIQEVYDKFKFIKHAKIITCIIVCYFITIISVLITLTLK